MKVKPENWEKSNDVASELSMMRIIHSELNNVEKDRSAGLYALLSIIIPPISLCNVFLNKRVYNL